MKPKKINPFIYIFFLLMYLEIIIKITINNNIFNISLLTLLIFTLPVALFLTIICKLFNARLNKIILLLITIITTIYFDIQFVFYRLFSIPFSFSTIGLANQAFDFLSIIKDTIITNVIMILLLNIPIIIIFIVNRFIDTTKYHFQSLLTLILMFITSMLFTTYPFLPFNKDATYLSNLYNKIDDKIAIIDNFGLLTYTKIDLKRQIFDYKPEIITEPAPIKKEPVKYGDNILNLNIKETSNDQIKSLNEYITNKQPSSKNKYTGMFKDKNLIFILAEGFNEIAVDKKRTPTLYKLTNSGFVFNNFYSPVFLSTTGGEFQATTGLIPTQEILKLWKKNKPTISYGLGNVFNQKGYKVQSYHNWTYSYYKRNETMKTLGFQNYQACGNGLEKRINCKWLPSDVEMVQKTTNDYLNKNQNFMTYYVTVSGHSPYNNSDNIAKKYLDLVAEENYSNPVKYYLAAQVELDRMLEELIKALEKNNQLEDTVIALVGDHYPYTLTTDQINEVSKYEKDGTIEVNHSNFILWNSEMKDKIEISKVGSQIDVLPTILNLFGVDYDSRLIVGQDLLSSTPGIAIFSNRSWITDYGSYNSLSRTFTKKKDVELTDENTYIKNTNNQVANAFTISKMIIANNYYSYILN